MLEEKNRKAKIKNDYWNSYELYAMISLILPVFFFTSTIEYLLSPFVLITNTPFDVALVQTIGRDYIKPLFIFEMIIGGIIGFATYSRYNACFSEVLEKGSVQLSRRDRLFVLHLPWFGLLGFILFNIISYLTPLVSAFQPWDWGAISTMLFSFPGFGFMISSSVLYIFAHESLKKKARKLNSQVISIHDLQDHSKRIIRLVSLD